MGKKQGSQATTKGANKSQQKKGGQQMRSGRSGGGPVKFAKDVRGELKKVSWPNREQLQQSTMVVILIVIVLMAYIYVWDFVFQTLAQWIFA